MDRNEGGSRIGARASLALAALAGAVFLAASPRPAAAQPGAQSPTPTGNAKKASATIEARSESKITGTATFEEARDAVHVMVEIAGAAPGDHGVHIHEKGDCSAPDASSAGPHFNPAGKTHGGPHTAMHHAGDLGNITIGPDGKGMLHLMSKDFTLKPGPRSIRGRSIVIHEKPDDLKSQPAGNSGPRVGCGVIR